MRKINLAKYAVLLLFVAVVVLFHKFGYIGHYGYDDMQYAKVAHDFLQDTVDYDDHYSYRAPVVLLTSLSYSLLGVSDFASAIPPLITTLFILVILFWILKDKNWKTILIALSLTTFSSWFIFWSDKLSSDIYVAFAVFAALAVLHQYKYHSTKKQAFLYAFLFAGALFFGFLAKETVILMLPLLLYVFIVDMIQKQDRKFWIYSILCGIGFLLTYLFIIKYLTGSFLNRFDAIVNNSYLNLCSYDQQSWRILLKRIVWDFWDMCVYQNMILGFVFVGAFLFQKNALSYFKMKDSFSFFLVSAILLILSCNFMCISFTAYSPMCIDPRHYLFLIPVVAIPASLIITQFMEEKKQAIPIIILLIGVSVLAFFSQGHTFSRLYLPVTLLFGLYLFLKPNKLFQTWLVIVFAIILSLQMVNWIKYAQSVQYGKQKEHIFKEIIQKNEKCYVITDEVQKRLGEYYTGFNPHSAIQFITFNEFAKNPNRNGKHVLLYNKHTLYLSKLNDEHLPYYVKNVDSSNPLFFEDRKLGMFMYEMTDLSWVDLTKYTVFYTINDFENLVPYWNDRHLISEDIKYAGEKSNKLVEYSATFEYPLDSLYLEDSNRLLIHCNLYCYFERPTNAQMVIAVENAGDTYIWRGFGINEYIRAYSNWWQAKCETEINANDLKPRSILKIYVWNEDKIPGYIDNFEISLKKM